MKKVMATLVTVLISVVLIFGTLFIAPITMFDAWAQTMVNVQRKMTIEKNMD